MKSGADFAPRPSGRSSDGIMHKRSKRTCEALRGVYDVTSYLRESHERPARHRYHEKLVLAPGLCLRDGARQRAVRHEMRSPSSRIQLVSFLLRRAASDNCHQYCLPNPPLEDPRLGSLQHLLQLGLGGNPKWAEASLGFTSVKQRRHVLDPSSLHMCLLAIQSRSAANPDAITGDCTRIICQTAFRAIFLHPFDRRAEFDNEGGISFRACLRMSSLRYHSNSHDTA